MSESFHDIFVMFALIIPYTILALIIGWMIWKIERIEEQDNTNTDKDIYEYNTEFGHGY